jgi:hypothetical protein
LEESSVIVDVFEKLERAVNLSTHDDLSDPSTPLFKGCFSKMNLDDFYSLDSIKKGFENFIEFSELCQATPPDSKWAAFVGDVATLLPPLMVAINAAMSRLEEISSSEELPVDDDCTLEQRQSQKAALLVAHPSVYEVLRSRLKLEGLTSTLTSFVSF